MSEKPPFTPTASQQQAIDARGGNILVNAGAGAGKTATLTRRVIGRLLDPESPVSLEQMLIVTFTRAAASEMRERISKALREQQETAIEDGNDEQLRHIDSELQSLPRARISTLHSYCSTLLQEFGDRVGVPPDFDMMDEDEALLLHHGRMREEMELIASDGTDASLLRDLLGQSSPVSGIDMLEKNAMRLQRFLESLDDPDAFVDGVIADCDMAESGAPFQETRWYQLLSGQMLEQASEILGEIDDYIAMTRGLALAAKGPISVRDVLKQVGDTLRSIEEEEDLDAFMELLSEGSLMPRRTPPGKNAGSDDLEAHEFSGELKKRIDEIVKKSHSLRKLGSVDGIAANIRRSAPFIRFMVTRLGRDMNRKLLEEHLSMRRLRFSDLERLALRILENPDGSPTEAALEVRSRTEEILVDEFQDVNGLQARLLKAIARPGDRKAGGNLFIVGDLKQSIYGFRQADPRKFKELYDQYKPWNPDGIGIPGARINLLNNYRTAPELLHLLNGFFERLFSDRIGQVEFDESHRFVPGLSDDLIESPRVEVLLVEKGGVEEEDQDESEEEPDDETLLLEGMEEEARAVAEQVLRLQDEGVRPGEIAILTRTGGGAASKLAQVFQHAGISFHTEAATGFLKQQEVLDFTALLRVLDNPCEDVALVGVLRGPVAEWTEDDLLTLRLFNKRAPLIDNLNAVRRDPDHELFEKARAACEHLERWRHASRRRPMGELFTQILEETDWCARVATLRNGDMRVGNLQYLVERGVQFDSFQRKGLNEFLLFLQRLEENGQDLGTPPAVPPTLDVVRLMTIHKSKGLEFRVVIIPYLGSRFHMGDIKEPTIWDREVGVACKYLSDPVPSEDGLSAANELLKGRIKERLLSEELRLLYVAMTRAKERLVLIGSRARNQKGEGFQERLANMAERELTAGSDWRHREVRRASSLLDWVLLGFLDQRGMGKPADPSGARESLRMHIVAASSAGMELGTSQPAPGNHRTKALADLEAGKPLIMEMIDRVNELSRGAIAPRIKVKVTATEAKRAWRERLDVDDSTPIRWRKEHRATADDVPEWWPSSLKPSGVSGGRHRGTINHRFMENLDFDAISGGATLEDEADRMVKSGILESAEIGELLFGRIRDIVELDPLGPELMALRHTIRREVPFRIGIPAEDLLKGHHVPDSIVLLQGVIDLIFEDTDGNLVIIDWKTDYWDGTPEHLEELRESYRPQLLLYMAGLKRATGREVSKAWLVFLQAGQPMEVMGDEDSGLWLEIVKSAVFMDD